MIYTKPQNVASLSINVLSTSGGLYALMDTAGGSGSEAYYAAQGVNSITICPEDGDVRFLCDATPTAAIGILLRKGGLYNFVGLNLRTMSLISTSLTPTKCNVQLSISDPSESNSSSSFLEQENRSDIIGYLTYQKVGGDMTLASNSTIATYTLVMTAGHSFSNGDEIRLTEGSNVFRGKVLNVATNTLTLDTPLDFAYTTACVVNEVVTNMNVNGSVTPQNFGLYLPATFPPIDISGFRVNMIDNTAMDDGTFGGIAALTRGVVLRVNRSNGTKKNLGNAKTNSDLSMMIDNIKYSDKAPAGTYGVQFEAKLKEATGSVIRLYPSDSIEIIVQDDLTNLISLKAFFYGHFTN